MASSATSQTSVWKSSSPPGSSTRWMARARSASMHAPLVVPALEPGVGEVDEDAGDAAGRRTARRRWWLAWQKTALHRHARSRGAAVDARRPARRGSRGRRRTGPGRARRARTGTGPRRSRSRSRPAGPAGSSGRRRANDSKPRPSGLTCWRGAPRLSAGPASQTASSARKPNSRTLSGEASVAELARDRPSETRSNSWLGATSAPSPAAGTSATNTKFMCRPLLPAWCSS